MNELYHPKTEKKQKVRLPLRAYLSYLLLATLLFTGVSFSKFASSGSAGDDARVAVVVVDGGGYEAETNLSLGNGVTTEEYLFYLTNYNEDDYVPSEVSLDYIVVVTMPDGQNLPAGVEMSLTYCYEEYDDNGEWLETVKKECLSIPSGEDGVYTFEGGADFAAGEGGYHDYILTFTMNESLVTGDANISGIEISVKAEQID